MISPWRAILARLSSPRRSVGRARRRARYPVGRSLEGLESRLLLSGTPPSIPNLPYNDSNLSPPGLQSVTTMPDLPVFNVKNYGATGNGTTDDTVAIRAAISAAENDGGGIIFFPAGTYAVDMQPGDTGTWGNGSAYPVIFPLTSSNLVFMGDGPTQSILSGYMPGLKNPVTNWNLTGNSYDPISRFGMFRIDSTNSAINNVQFRSLGITGNLGWTGNYDVGGVAATGDGWDLSSKGIAFDGANDISNILIFNVDIYGWRGEEIYGGGSDVGSVYIVNDDLYGTDGDAISISGNVLIDNTTMGGTSTGDDVYNGIEDFSLGAPQQTTVENSIISVSSDPSAVHGYGIAYLGLPTSSLTVTNTQLENNDIAILYSEVASNVIIQDNTFTNNNGGMIDSILGLYPQYPTGFSDFLIDGNTFNDSGAAFVSQFYSPSTNSFDNLVIRNNTVENGSVLLSGGYYGPAWSNFIVADNTIGTGGGDINNTSDIQADNYAIWSDNSYASGSSNGYGSSYAVQINDASTETTTSITPITQVTVLEGNETTSGSQYVSIPLASNYYPVGFETTFIAGPYSPGNWVLPANSFWNTWTSNIPVGTAGVTIQMGANGLFSVVQPSSTKLAFAQSPTTGTAGQALSSVSVDVENSSGGIVTSDNSSVVLTLSGGTFANGATSIVAQAVNGVATFSNLIIDAAGGYTLTANDGELTSATSAALTVNPAAASTLAFIVAPFAGFTGQALYPGVEVAVEDQFGNVITTNSSTVTLALSSGTFSTGTASTTAQAVNGIATFSSLTLNNSGNYTLSASDGSLTGSTSNSISISPYPTTTGASSKLAFTQTPTSGTAGTALGTAVQVSVEDANGNVVTSDTSTVTLTLNGGVFTGGGTTETVQAVFGVATFSNLIIDTSGNLTFSASDGSLTGASSSTVAISAGPPTKIAFMQTPSSGVMNQSLNPAVSVAVEDQFGNVVTQNNSSVSILVSSGPSGFNSSSTTSVTAVNGLATFNNLSFGSVAHYNLYASDGSLSGAGSSSINITATGTNKLAFSQAPTSGTAGQSLSPALQVSVENQSGSVVTSDTTTVTLTLSGGVFASGGTTVTAQAVNGVATFSSLVIDAAGSYKLTASDGSYTGATSSSITISPATASKLVITQAPTTGTAGQSLGTALKVSVEDTFGNVVTSNTSTVAVAIASGPGTFGSGSTTSVAAVNGVATFSNVSLAAAGTYTLSVTDGSLTSATSGSIVVSASSAAKLAISQSPTTGTAGQALGSEGFGRRFVRQHRHLQHLDRDGCHRRRPRHLRQRQHNVRGGSQRRCDPQ